MADSRRRRSNARLIHGRREPEAPLWAIFSPCKARQRRPAFFLPFSFLSLSFFTKYRTRLDRIVAVDEFPDASDFQRHDNR